jgi:hypothetical protein
LYGTIACPTKRDAVDRAQPVLHQQQQQQVQSKPDKD